MIASPRVLLVTDPRWAAARVDAVVAAAARALPPDAFAVQLRDKAATGAKLASDARRLRALASEVGALFVVNAADDASLAVASDVGADGAHVPCRASAIDAARARLGPAAWISTPAHTDDDVGTAASSGASAVLVSPIFPSPGKGPPRGAAALRSARARAGASVAVLALGGVDEANTQACADAGADGVAIIRALLDARDVARAARALFAAFGTAVHL